MASLARLAPPFAAAAIFSACAGDPFAFKDQRIDPGQVVRRHTTTGRKRILPAGYAECYRAAARALGAAPYYSITRDYAAVYADEFHGMSAVGVYFHPTGRDDRTQVEVVYARENEESFEPSRRLRAEESLLDDVVSALLRGEAASESRAGPDRAAARGIPDSEIDSVAGLPVRRRPLDFAVVVGAERHKAIGDADYALRDAEAFRKHAESVLGVPRANLVFLGDRTATREEILGALANLRGTAQPASRVWFYFAGHGGAAPENGDAYLATWELEPRYWSRTGIPLAELFRQLEELPALEVVAVFDASFSGYGDRSWNEAALPPSFTERRPSPSRSSKVKAFFATAPGQGALVAHERGHGLFTYEFLRKLGDPDAPDSRRLDDVMSSAWKAVRSRASAEGRRQDPTAGGSGMRIDL